MFDLVCMLDCENIKQIAEKAAQLLTVILLKFSSSKFQVHCFFRY